MRFLAKYRNGNLTTTLYEDGTRERYTDDDEFHPAFAENIDIHTSDRCDHGCGFCYANCTVDGKFGTLNGWKFLDTLHPGQECAINLNFPVAPDLVDFIRLLRKKHVFPNVTINQDHFEKNEEFIENLYNEHLIYGLGISLVNPTEEFIKKVKKYPNAVIHVINGIFDEHDYQVMKDNDLKLLILGYKDIGRGVLYKDNNVIKNQKWLYDNLHEVTKSFKVISFDNLSLEQLNVKRLLTEEQWNEFYGGDEGTFSFFINLVDGYFAINSLSDVHYPIGDKTVNEMFEVINHERME